MATLKGGFKQNGNEDTGVDNMEQEDKEVIYLIVGVVIIVTIISVAVKYENDDYKKVNDCYKEIAKRECERENKTTDGERITGVNYKGFACRIKATRRSLETRETLYYTKEEEELCNSFVTKKGLI